MRMCGPWETQVHIEQLPSLGLSLVSALPNHKEEKCSLVMGALCMYVQIANHDSSRIPCPVAHGILLKMYLFRNLPLCEILSGWNEMQL